MIKAIIFDIGGVLKLNNDKFRKFSVHKYVADKFKLNLDTYFDSMDTAYVTSISGEISKNELFKILEKNFSRTKKEILRVYSKAYNKSFKTNKKLFEASMNLRKKGFKIGILSDQWEISKESLLKDGLFNGFDSFVVSCDVGCRKPEKKIFNLSLKELKVKASEAVFIDNRKWNTDVANKMGIKTVLFKNNNQCLRDLENLGVRL